MRNRLTVYHIKGGTGKTRIALNIALTLDCGIITNDEYSIVSRVISSSKCRILAQHDDFPRYPAKIPLVYDLGGKIDKRVGIAIEESRYVIVPILPYKEDIQTGLDFITEIQAINSKIIIVVNKTKPKQFDNIRKVLKGYYPYFPVFELKSSTAMSRMIWEKKSIREITNTNKLFRHHYQKLNQQFDQLINYIQTHDFEWPGEFKQSTLIMRDMHGLHALKKGNKNE